MSPEVYILVVSGSDLDSSIRHLSVMESKKRNIAELRFKENKVYFYRKIDSKNSAEVEFDAIRSLLCRQAGSCDSLDIDLK
jgi:hypothetical protein